MKIFRSDKISKVTYLARDVAQWHEKVLTGHFRRINTRHPPAVSPHIERRHSTRVKKLSMLTFGRNLYPPTKKIGTKFFHFNQSLEREGESLFPSR